MAVKAEALKFSSPSPSRLAAPASFPVAARRSRKITFHPPRSPGSSFKKASRVVRKKSRDSYGALNDNTRVVVLLVPVLPCSANGPPIARNKYTTRRNPIIFIFITTRRTSYGTKSSTVELFGGARERQRARELACFNPEGILVHPKPGYANPLFQAPSTT